MFPNMLVSAMVRPRCGPHYAVTSPQHKATGLEGAGNLISTRSTFPSSKLDLVYGPACTVARISV